MHNWLMFLLENYDIISVFLKLCCLLSFRNLLTKVKKEKRPKKVQSEDKKESVKLSQEENIQRKSIVETLTRVGYIYFYVLNCSN